MRIAEHVGLGEGSRGEKGPREGQAAWRCGYECCWLTRGFCCQVRGPDQRTDWSGGSLIFWPPHSVGLVHC